MLLVVLLWLYFGITISLAKHITIIVSGSTFEGILDAELDQLAHSERIQTHDMLAHFFTLQSDLI
jgi:hypothetical protein